MTNRKILRRAKSKAAVVLVSVLGAGAANALDTTVNFGGYVKLDAIYSRFSDNQLAPGVGIVSASRDFYIPSLTPTVGGDERDFIDFHAKQSRFHLKIATKFENGEVVKGFIEMDFGPGNEPSNGERTTNRSGVDLRHAILTWRNWTFGQTWSTLLNGSSIAETLDFFALSEGMIDTRQALIRYTNGPFAIALENPVTRVRGAAGDRETDDGTVPDVVAKYTHKADWGNVSIAGIVRQLKMEQGNVDDTETGFGISVAGRIKSFGKDDVRFSVTSGEGLGRYIGLALNDDARVTADNQLETIDSTAFNIGYRHVWSRKWRSTLGYAHYDADETGDGGVNAKSRSIHANLLFSPIKPLTFGVEYIRGELEKESGADGELDRVQFSAIYNF